MTPIGPGRRSTSLPIGVVGVGFFFIIIFLFLGLPAARDLRARAFSAQGSAGAREDAYRANNLGVARLEQFDYQAAASAFRRAIELDAGVAVAHANLAIALFYAGDHDGARREAQIARERLPALLQPRYVLGLVARADNQPAAAIAAFTEVRTIDPDDVGTSVNLGQLALAERRDRDAVALFTAAARDEPYNATAVYGLAMALLRSGAAAEGAAAMERFNRLKDSGFAITYSQNYLEQGRYGEAIASVGSEAGLVDERVPDAAFTDATASVLPAQPVRQAVETGGADDRLLGRSVGDGDPASTARSLAIASGGGVALADLDGDGDLDLIDADQTGIHVYSNTSGRFVDVTDRVGLAATAGGVPTGVIVGDYDNDGRPDLFVLRQGGHTLYRNTVAGFIDATKTAGLPVSADLCRSAAWADVDHDGDLDLVVACLAGVAPARVASARFPDSFPPARLQLFRNNGNGTFADITAEARLSAAIQSVGVLPTDYDNRRDVDILVATYSGGPLLFRNLRDGTFRDVAGDARLAIPGRVSALAAGDVNKDDYTDLFFGRLDEPGIFATSDGRAQFTTTAAPAVTRNTLAAQFIDYDNDGLLDLLAITADGARLLRNLGDRWTDVTARAIPGRLGQALHGMPALATGDLDGDGDVDLVVRTPESGLAIWRNDGGSARSLRVRLAPRVSNRSAVGAKIEMRAGSLREKLETYAVTPAVRPADVVFGLGRRAGADVVRVLWPSGILQAETGAPAGAPLDAHVTDPLQVTELDRKPSSCPYLYTWNGTRFEFITDFLGAGEMGYLESPGVHNTPDSDEYVRIAGDRLKPQEGKYALRITNELEEALFLDRVQLLSIAHPAAVDVFPNEGMGPVPHAFHVYTVQGARPPIAAVDEHGHDVLDLVARLDRRYPDDFRVERIRGYAAPHHITLTLPPGDRRLLLLTGWTDYAFSADNLAASQAGLTPAPPSLEMADRDGRWHPVIEDIGLPVGRPQTVPVDLTGRVPGWVRQVRISTTMRVYWDQILVDTSDQRAPVEIVRLDPADAVLRWRGFSGEHTPDGRQPLVPDYRRVSPASPWKRMPGRYTREGDVRPLLAAVDDMFVMAQPGDEMALSFDARELPPLPVGWSRTFLLYADGFSKEMDLNSASPDQLAPLPFHGMSRYPYVAPEAYPSDAAHRAYLEQYNTRIVRRAVPSIDAIARHGSTRDR